MGRLSYGLNSTAAPYLGLSAYQNPHTLILARHSEPCWCFIRPSSTLTDFLFEHMLLFHPAAVLPVPVTAVCVPDLVPPTDFLLRNCGSAEQQHADQTWPGQPTSLNRAPLLPFALAARPVARPRMHGPQAAGGLEVTSRPTDLP